MQYKQSRFIMNLNEAFKTTCHILFGQEIGEFEEFEQYLRDAAIGKSVKSFFSKKDLWVTSTHYCEKARFFDYNSEQNELVALPSSLDINQVKDIDSLISGVKENLVYSGNKVLGNSSNVSNSDDVTSSHYVLGCSMIVDSKYMAYSYLMRKNEFVFGSTSSGESSYIMRCFYNNKLKRCFECCTSVESSDCYFCYNVMACADCMFTFNLRGKTHTIANVQLEKADYAELKKKLVNEIADELKRKKRMDFSVIDIINNS